VALLAVGCGLTLTATRAGATTDSATLVGEGGSFLTPVTDLLLKSDTGLSPLVPSYDDANIDNAIGDFVGTAPGSFGTDFVVSERPLTSAEAATASANGRSFAYVPIAATPVAIAALAVCNPGAIQDNSELAFCRNIQLTVPLVAALFTANLTNPTSTPNTNLFPELSSWSDTRIAGGEIPGTPGIFQASTLEPSAENTALLSLIDSNPVAREQLDNALNTPASDPQTTSDVPSEKWPFHSVHGWVGGDAGLIGKELSIDAETNAPAQLSGWTGLGNGAGPYDVFPLSGVWTGSPEGTPWNVPTAQVQNAQGAFVGPTEAAAAAAESDAVLDPSTNLVTFNTNPGNAAAYNNYLMEESYLVVPTTGLPAAKAKKLAQFIRFATGPTAQSDEEVLGAAPPTAAMVAADLKVATELDTESVASTNAATSAQSTSTTAPAAGSAASAGIASSASAVSSTDAGAGSGSGATPATADTSSAGGLAFTGAPDLVPIVGIGAALFLLGMVGRRRYRRSEVSR